jgi:hypothetical protein
MPPTHAGDSTHHHDQLMTPVSLSTISVIHAIWKAADGADALLHATLGRQPVPTPDILPAYGAGVREAMAAKLPLRATHGRDPGRVDPEAPGGADQPRVCSQPRA